MTVDPHSLQALLAARLDEIVKWALTSGLRILLLLLLAAIFLRLVRLLTKKLSNKLIGLTESLEQQKRTQTISNLVSTVATTLLLLVTGMLVLSEVGVNLAPILAAAGVGGLAIGFVHG